MWATPALIESASHGTDTVLLGKVNPRQEHNFLLQSSRELGRNLKRADLDLRKCLENLFRNFTEQL